MGEASDRAAKLGDKAQCGKWGTEELCNPCGRPRLAGIVLAPVPVFAWPRGVWPWRHGNNALPCPPQPSTPTWVPGVPAHSLSPAPPTAALPAGGCPVGDNTLFSGGTLRGRLPALEESLIALQGRADQARGPEETCGHGEGVPGSAALHPQLATHGDDVPVGEQSPDNFWEKRRALSVLAATRDQAAAGSAARTLAAPRRWGLQGTDAANHRSLPSACLPAMGRGGPGSPGQVWGCPPTTCRGTLLRHGPRPWRHYAVTSHAGGRARAINFLPWTLSPSTKPLLYPVPQQLSQKRAAPRPAYLAWCWFPAPRSHEARSPGTAPHKSRLNTCEADHRRSSAPPGKPFLRGGSAGRGSAGSPPPGALLRGGRPAAEPLRGAPGGGEGLSGRGGGEEELR